MHTKEDVDELVRMSEFMYEWLAIDKQTDVHSITFGKALEPFRDPRPRVGVAWYGPIEGDSPPFFEGSVKAIELTEAVRKALKDAGVEVDDELAD